MERLLQCFHLNCQGALDILYLLEVFHKTRISPLRLAKQDQQKTTLRNSGIDQRQNNLTGNDNNCFYKSTEEKQ
jgi:hypothetical protein